MNSYLKFGKSPYFMQKPNKLLALSITVAMFLGGNLASAATISVNNTTCTLADAITAANEDTATGGCLAGSGYDTLDITADITLTAMLPFLESNMTLEGNNHFVSGNNQYSIFFVKSNTVTFSNLTIKNGRAKGGHGGSDGGGAGLGGGLFIYDGTVTVDTVTFANNQAIGGDSGSNGYNGGNGGLSACRGFWDSGGDNHGSNGTCYYDNDGSSSLYCNGAGNGGYGGNGGDGACFMGGCLGGGNGGFCGHGGDGSIGGNGGFGGSGGNGRRNRYDYEGNAGNGGFGGGGGNGSGGEGSGGHGGFGGGGGSSYCFACGGSGGYGGGDSYDQESGKSFGSGGGGAGFGGAIFAKNGTLILKDVTFTNNSASGGSGNSVNVQNHGLGRGGALFICTPKEGGNGCNAVAYACNIKYIGNSATNGNPNEFGTLNEVECKPCLVYNVHDEGLNDSQFFTVDIKNQEVNILGESYLKHDIEALDIHPQNGELYAASGDDTNWNKRGYLYKVNKIIGHLMGIGPIEKLTDSGYTRCKEVDALSFHPDGTLWGWAQDCGLLTINTDTGKADVIIPASQVEVEDITWNTAGTTLYGVENLHRNHHPDSHRALDFDQGVRLWTYNSKSGIDTVCDDITQSLKEIEALETLPDDSLLFGFHGIDGILNVGALDVQNCQLIAQEELPTVPYNDVEGIAWPAKACAK